MSSGTVRSLRKPESFRHGSVGEGSGVAVLACGAGVRVTALRGVGVAVGAGEGAITVMPGVGGGGRVSVARAAQAVRSRPLIADSRRQSGKAGVMPASAGSRRWAIRERGIRA